MKHIYSLSFLALLFLSFISFKKTVANLQAAYLAEINASRRYKLYSEKAQKEGYEEVARLFRALSKSEDIHALNHERALEKAGQEPLPASYEELAVRSTRENLEKPIESEKEEAGELYPRYIEEAKEEKAEFAVQAFTYAMNSEAQHEKLLKNALKRLGKNEKRDYYVSNVTGETFSVSPSSSAPSPKLPAEQYLWIE